MKYLRPLVLSGTVLSLVMAASAYSQTASQDQSDPAPSVSSTPDRAKERRSRGFMSRLDTNNDGAIQLEEMTRVNRHAAADTDGDGILSQEEIEAMVLKRMVERQARQLTRRLDVDGDGVVTLAEIENQDAKRFALMDRNDDGKLERSELRQMKSLRKGRHGNKFRHHARHGGWSDGPRHWR